MEVRGVRTFRCEIPVQVGYKMNNAVSIPSPHKKNLL